jgi:hypothetical protein
MRRSRPPSAPPEPLGASVGGTTADAPRPTRRTFLGLVAAGALASPGLSAAAAPAPATTRRDERILRYALGLEQMQAAFYAEAVARGVLRGRLLRFATVVAAHERAHVAYLRGLLGPSAARAPRFRFGDATRSPRAFLETAVLLEDTGVVAYNGVGPLLSPRAIAAAGRIVSVDARHAAWARALQGRPAALEPTDPGRSEAQVRARIDRLGFVP